MRGNALMSAAVLFVIALFLALPGTSQAQELKEGITQGDFALWLVKAIGAQSKLPPAAQAEDAIKFLTGLGSIPDPDKGWQKNEPMTKELLANLLDNPEEGANLSWDELVEKVRDRLQMIFDERTLGAFRIQSSGTPSAVA